MPIVGKIYQHFKTKGIYRVVAIAKHSETLEDMVIYEPVDKKYACIGDINATHWARPLSMWDEITATGEKRFQEVE